MTKQRPTADDVDAALHAVSVWGKEWDDSQVAVQRRIAKAYGIPDALVGLPTPWWRRWWQRYVTRRP